MAKPWTLGSTTNKVALYCLNVALRLQNYDMCASTAIRRKSGDTTHVLDSHLRSGEGTRLGEYCNAALVGDIAFHQVLASYISDS